jgi:hypothetical protein
MAPRLWPVEASASIPRGARSQIGRDVYHAMDYLTGARRELRNTPPQELCGFKVSRLRRFVRRGVRWRYSERSGKSRSPIHIGWNIRLHISGKQACSDPELSVLLRQRPEILDCRVFVPVDRGRVRKSSGKLIFPFAREKRFAELSANFLNCHAGPPMYVGLP